MNHHVPGQSLTPQASLHHILFIQNLDQSWIQRLDPTSYAISQDRDGNLTLAPHLREADPSPPPEALLLRLPVPAPQRYAFRLLDHHYHGEPHSPPFLVNGQPHSCHDLVHGDLVQLGQGVSFRYYTLPSSLDLATLQDLLQLSNGEHWYETCLNIFNSFSSGSAHLSAPSLQAGLNHLALLTEFTPELIIELDAQGNLLYLNASAWKQFPDLLEQGHSHPLFSGLQLQEGHQASQEITLAQKRFFRTPQWDPVYRRLRLFIQPCPETPLPSHSGELETCPDSVLPSPPPASDPSAPRETPAYDYLTHLPERGAVESYLQAQLAQNQESLIAVCLLDFDGFTRINEVFGYREGDQILQALSVKLKEVLSENTFCGRWAGDEFMIILSASTLEQIHQVAQTVIARFQSQVVVEQHETYVTASIGIALAPEQGEETAALIEKAYTALRQAKHQGKQCYQIYSPEIVMETPNRWQEELKFALEREQLSVHYQPIINPQTGRILSLEALLRWQHHQYGFIDPAQFIPLAEETGVIFAMGEWILRTVCLQHQRWQRMGLPKLSIAINFSSRQLQQPELRSKISQIIEQTEFESPYLMIEVKEETLVEDLTHAPRIFWELVELGLRFCVDNFGQENSSFSRLQQLPIASLKTDRSLVEKILSEEEALRVLEAILKLSKSLKLQLVIKGVETKEQLALLRELQAQAVQGDFIYGAMPSFQMTQILQKHFQHTV